MRSRNARADPGRPQGADQPKRCGSAWTNRLERRPRRSSASAACGGAVRGASVDRPEQDLDETEPSRWPSTAVGPVVLLARELSQAARRHLWMHFTRLGGGARRAGADHRLRRGLLRLRRRRQALPRRPLGAVLRQRRPRPRRARRGGRGADARARLLHQLELRAPARDRARDADRRARARRPQPRVLHLGRLGGGRVGAEARARVSPADRQRAEDEGHRARDRLPRDDARRARRRPASPRSASPFEPLAPGGCHVAEHELLPLAGGARPALGRRRDRRADRVRGARDGRRGDPRAGPERRRLHPAAGRLLPARARDLRPPRRAADLRRGDLLVGADRPLVRLRALRLPAGHHHDRQGADLGVRADGRDDRVRPHRRAVPAAGTRASPTASRSAATRSRRRSRSPTST